MGLETLRPGLQPGAGADAGAGVGVGAGAGAGGARHQQEEEQAQGRGHDWGPGPQGSHDVEQIPPAIRVLPVVWGDGPTHAIYPKFPASPPSNSCFSYEIG